MKKKIIRSSFIMIVFIFVLCLVLDQKNSIIKDSYAYIIDGNYTNTIPEDLSLYNVDVSCKNGTVGRYENGQIVLEKLNTNNEKCQLVLTTRTDNLIKRNIEEANYLNGLIKNEEIESIEFVNTNEVPQDAIYSWDVSEQRNGSIMAWDKDLDQNGKYEVYIGQKGGVQANVDSSYLFKNLVNLTSLSLDNFMTKNVINMEGMFSDTKLVKLDLSHFDTTEVNNISSMFYDCLSLNQLDLRNMIFDKVDNAKSSFYKLNTDVTIYAKDSKEMDKIKSFGAPGVIIDCVNNVCP